MCGIGQRNGAVGVADDDANRDSRQHGIEPLSFGLGLADRLEGLALALAQHVRDPLLLGDVPEEYGNPVQARIVDAEGKHVVPAAKRTGLILEAGRYARKRNLAIDVEPVLFMVGEQVRAWFCPAAWCRPVCWTKVGLISQKR